MTRPSSSALLYLRSSRMTSIEHQPLLRSGVMSLIYNRLMQAKFNFGLFAGRAWRAPLFLAALSAVFFTNAATAQLSIEITGGGANRIPIAIAPFAGEGLLPQA